MTEMRQLTDAEAKREAIGRTLALIGSGVGLAGTAMLLSINPKVQSMAGSTLRRLPVGVQSNRLVAGIAASALVVALIAVWYRKKLRGG